MGPLPVAGFAGLAQVRDVVAAMSWTILQDLAAWHGATPARVAIKPINFYPGDLAVTPPEQPPAPEAGAEPAANTPGAAGDFIRLSRNRPMTRRSRQSGEPL